MTLHQHDEKLRNSSVVYHKTEEPIQSENWYGYFRFTELLLYIMKVKSQEDQ